MNKSNKKMNRRGFFLGETTLKVIIAVLGILILVFLMYKLYDTFSGQDDLKKATATLDEVVQRVSIVQSQGGEIEFTLVNPINWVLVSFASGQNKLCVCEKDTAWSVWKNQEETCKKSTTGICKTLDATTQKEIEILPTNILIKNNNGQVEITAK